MDNPADYWKQGRSLSLSVDGRNLRQSLNDRNHSGQLCGRGLAWSMISACQYSVQQNADDPGGRFQAAREFKSRRPHQKNFPDINTSPSLDWRFDHAAVNRNHCTIDVARLVASQERYKIADLFRSPITSERHVKKDLFHRLINRFSSSR
jgi:hypothetical protein